MYQLLSNDIGILAGIDLPTKYRIIPNVGY